MSRDSDRFIFLCVLCHFSDIVYFYANIEIQNRVSICPVYVSVEIVEKFYSLSSC